LLGSIGCGRFLAPRRAVNDAEGIVMSGRRPPIKGYFQRCADRGCGHVFGLSCGENRIRRPWCCPL